MLDLSLILCSIVLHSLTKFLWFVLFVGSCDTQKPFSFFFFYSEFMFFLYISVLGSCCCFLYCFSNFIYLSSLIFCWYLSSFAMLIFELMLHGMFSCFRVRIIGFSEGNFSRMFLLVLQLLKLVLLVLIDGFFCSF